MIEAQKLLALEERLTNLEKSLKWVLRHA
jgi:hypothetical protein